MKNLFNIISLIILIVCFTNISCSSNLSNHDKPTVIEYKKSLFKAPFVKRTYWPTGGWKMKKPSEVGISENGLKLMEEYAFNRQKPERERKGIRTDCVLIIKKGYLIYEKYTGEFHKDKPHLIWSVTKSFVNAIYGIAVKEGRVGREKFAHEYYTKLNQGKQAEITIDHLLRMSSGLFSREGYEASPFNSTVVAMLYSEGKSDMADYAVSIGMEADPGIHWEYASPSANLLMGIIKKTMSKDEYNNYPWSKIFGPLGMKSVTWEQDASGTFVGSSYLFMTARDLAKFGFLYLNDGKWEGKNILPEGWVEYTTTIAPALYTTKFPNKQNVTYGALFWLNQSIGERGIGKFLPNAPEDTFLGTGHWGQFVVIVPSLDMVVVYYGDNRDGSFKLDRLLHLIIDSHKDGSQ